MTLRSVFTIWHEFFFAEQSPTPIALFRILYGALVVATLTLLRPDWQAWYGVHGWVSLATASGLETGTRLSLFSVIPQNDNWIEALFWLSLASAILLSIGFLTRLNSVLVFICLASIQQRNLYITHGGDTFLRCAGFFLMFAPAGAALSVDRLIRVRRGREPADIRPRSPWAQRMIQLQLALLYFVAFLVKVKGAPWLQGTALFYVYHLDELRRFPLPSWFFHPMVFRLGSWSALVLEFSLGILIWVKEFRYVILALGLFFHLWLEYSLNIPLFQWDILSAYVLFIDSKDLSRGRTLDRPQHGIGLHEAGDSDNPSDTRQSIGKVGKDPSEPLGERR
jgi:Vitamin K-dependent gamma-carboxylase